MKVHVTSVTLLLLMTKFLNVRIVPEIDEVNVSPKKIRFR